MRVAVVGAGLAGLSAAERLLLGGAEVVVLEARDRVGGRVWSRRLGLGIWEKGMAYGRREPRGGIAPVTDDDLRAAAASIARLDVVGSAAAVLDRLDHADAVREAIRARVEVSAAAPADQVGADELSGVAAFSDAPSWGIAGGNQSLALALAERVDVRLQTPVRRVEWGEQVRADDLAADAVVVAVPAPVLETIAFDPPLPVRDAVRALRYGHAAKLFVPLAERPAASAVLSVPERYWTWTAAQAGEVQPVAGAFAGSPAALERLAVGEGPDRWLASLAALRPDLALQPEGAVLSTWSDDPYARGAYSVHTPGGNDPALAQRFGPLVLAGEYTAGSSAALMEGALASGIRAAEQLLVQ